MQYDCSALVHTMKNYQWVAYSNPTRLYKVLLSLHATEMYFEGFQSGIWESWSTPENYK